MRYDVDQMVKNTHVHDTRQFYLSSIDEAFIDQFGSQICILFLNVSSLSHFVQETTGRK